MDGLVRWPVRWNCPLPHLQQEFRLWDPQEVTPTPPPPHTHTRMLACTHAGTHMHTQQQQQHQRQQHMSYSKWIISKCNNYTINEERLWENWGCLSKDGKSSVTSSHRKAQGAAEPALGAFKKYCFYSLKVSGIYTLYFDYIHLPTLLLNSPSSLRLVFLLLLCPCFCHCSLFFF